MPRIKRNVAMDLILYCKKLHVFADAGNLQKSISALEFARQMSSPKLKKQNPAFECDYFFTRTGEPSYFIADYVDGTTLRMNTADHICQDLRDIFFEKALEAEEYCDDNEIEIVKSDGDAATGGKGGAAGSGKGKK
jgi:hypothetical protein